MDFEDVKFFIVLFLCALPILLLWWLIRIGGRAQGADWGNAGMNVTDGLNRLFCQHYHRFKFDRIDLPETGSAIVVSNHISGLDPMLLVAATNRPLRFLIAKEEYERFGLTWIFRAMGCISVDRSGRAETAFRQALAALKSGEVIAIFPHGGIHLASDPPRKLKRGAMRLAKLAGCPVYPAHLSGVVGEGHVIPAIVGRGRANLIAYAAHAAEDIEHDGWLEVLSQELAGEHPES